MDEVTNQHRKFRSGNITPWNIVFKVTRKPLFHVSQTHPENLPILTQKRIMKRKLT